MTSHTIYGLNKNRSAALYLLFVTLPWLFLQVARGDGVPLTFLE